jgi:D-alanyl-D-alanine carboxypeptidase/D-alanyl-D-alanine-endopeptidase (penicillin-binding protein 4)
MLRTLAVLVALACAAPAAAGDDLASQLAAVMDGPDYRHAYWGALVVEAETGRVVFERNPDRLATPASVTKMYSCAAALGVLGADHRFETVVVRRGDVEGGLLKGDLVLVASGDLTLGGRTDANGRCLFADSDHIYASPDSTGTGLTPTDPLAGIDALAAQVAKAGVREVQGEVFIDDRLFEPAQGSGSGPDLVTPIIVNDNLVDVVITPGPAPDAPATVKVRPECALVTWEADVVTVPSGRKPDISVRGTGPQRFSVRGRIPAGSKPLVRVWEVDAPALVARALFIESLRRHGVRVVASPLAAPRESLPPRETVAGLPKVATFTSPPLSEAIKVTLKVSHNLYASTLPLLLAARHGERTHAAGLRRQRDFLRQLGLDTDSLSFGGGAGGARADRVTPRQTVALIQGMAKRPEWAVYREGLPLLGVDGTLASVIPKDSPARGKVSAKTGTLFWHDSLNDRSLLQSKALAGVLETHSGKTLYVALFVNDVPLPAGVGPSREGAVLGRLCELIHRYGP